LKQKIFKKISKKNLKIFLTKFFLKNKISEKDILEKNSKKLFSPKKVSKTKIVSKKSLTHFNQFQPTSAHFTLFHPFSTPYLPPKQTGLYT